MVALDDTGVPPAAAVALAVGAARDVGAFGSEEVEGEEVNGDGREEMVQMRMALHLAAPRVRAAWNFYEQVRMGWGKGKGAETKNTNEEGKDMEEGEESCKRMVCEEGTAWVDWYGEPLCDVEALLARAAHDTIDAGEQVTATANSYVSLSPTLFLRMRQPITELLQIGAMFVLVYWRLIMFYRI